MADTDTESKKRKKISITDEDIYALLPKYSAMQVLALLREVSQSKPDLKIDWNALAKNTSIGIDDARECQMLWRHLAYGQPLLDNLQPGSQPLDDDSDLEYELEASPPVSADVLMEAAHCVKILAGGSPSESLIPNSSTVEGDTHNGQSSQIFSEHPHPSLLHSSNVSIPVSVQKQTKSEQISGEGLDGNGAANSNFPFRRRRKPWSEEEDLVLINAVRKHGEGIWATIVKSEFNGNRTASQLSQRWAILKKKQGSLTMGVNGSQLSEQHLATRRALEQALKNTLTAVGNGATGTSHSTNLKESNKDLLVTNDAMSSQQQVIQVSNTPVKLGPMGSTLTPHPLPRKVPVKPSVTIDSLQATAVAVGARVANLSDGESLVRVAQTKNAIHIRGGGSLIKSSAAGNTGSLPPNVHFIRTGLAATPTTVAAGTPSYAVGGHQAKGSVVKPSAPIVSVSQLSGTKLERSNATPPQVNEFQQMENNNSGEVKVPCSNSELAMEGPAPPEKDQSTSPSAVGERVKQTDCVDSQCTKSKEITKTEFEGEVCRKATENHNPNDNNEKASAVQQSGNPSVMERREILPSSPSLVVDESVENIKP